MQEKGPRLVIIGRLENAAPLADARQRYEWFNRETERVWKRFRQSDTYEGPSNVSVSVGEMEAVLAELRREEMQRGLSDERNNVAAGLAAQLQDPPQPGEHRFLIIAAQVMEGLQAVARSMDRWQAGGGNRHFVLTGLNVLQIIEKAQKLGLPAIAPRTVNSRIGEVRTMFAYLTTRGECDANPFEGMSEATLLPKIPRPLRDNPSHGLSRWMLEATRNRLFPDATNGQGWHSFRHLFQELGRASGAPDCVTDRLAGRVPAGVGRGWG